MFHQASQPLTFILPVPCPLCSITSGTFGDGKYFQDLVDNVNDMTKGNDWFLVANDFADYCRAQEEVDQVCDLLGAVRPSP